MKIGAIIEARLGSERFPNKVLREIQGKTLLGWVIDAARSANTIDEVVVDVPFADAKLGMICDIHNVSIHLGSTNRDVLGDFAEIAKTHKFDVIVRLTADCPCVTGKIIAASIAKFHTNRADFAYNSRDGDFNDGVDVQIVRYSLLEWANREATKPYDREHVMPFIRRCPLVREVFAEKQWISEKLSVDTPEDLTRVEEYLRRQKIS